MKLMIASDIHGSYFYCEKLLSAFAREKAEKLLLLGDLLYHGPRNDLPLGYAPKKVTEALNGIKDKLLCVRGNCDTEVDQMVLDFPIMAEYAVFLANERTVYATHGHHFGETDPLPLSRGDILLCGHTHIPKCKETDGFFYMNAGSVSLPKENSPHSYMTWEKGQFLWKDLDGTVYQSYTVEGEELI